MGTTADIGGANPLGIDGVHLDAVIELMPHAVIVFGIDWEVLHANSTSQELAGRIAVDWSVSPEEQIAAAFDADLKPMTVDRHPVELTRLTGVTVSDFEIGFPQIGGGRIWLRINTRPFFRDANTGNHAVVCSCTEVSAQRAGLDMANRRFAQGFKHALIGMAIVTLDGGFEDVNPALCALTGYSAEEMLALGVHDLTHPDDHGSDLSLLEDMLAGRRSGGHMYKRYIRSDGEVIWVQLSIALVSDENGTPVNFIAQLRDVTERRRMQQRLQELAERDHLTGIFNRRRFEEELQRQLERCRRSAESAAILLVDLDHFKRVNDDSGHAAGDRLLCAVAEICSRRVRGSDLVARIGGDEFAVILADVGEEGAMRVAEDLGTAIRKLEGIGVTASIGVALIEREDEVDTVLARADSALYSVKHAGRDGVAAVPA